MNTFVLQFKGDKSFSLFSQVTDAESLSQTWRLCTKISAHLEQGERLENLSWRLFYLHSVMAGETNTGDTRTFKRLSKETGQRLDRERHLRLTQLTAPRLRSSHRSNTPAATVSATLHHPSVVCSISTNPLVGLTATSLISCSTITTSSPLNTPHMSPYDLDFRTGSFNLESFLSNFSPLALLSAVDCYSDTVGNPVDETSQDLSYTYGPQIISSSENFETCSNATTPSDWHAIDEPMSATAELRSLNHEILPSPIAWENPSIQSSFSDWATTGTMDYSPVPSSPGSILNSATTFKCISSISRLPSLGEKNDFIGNEMWQISSPSLQSDFPYYQSLGMGAPALCSPLKNTPAPSSHKLDERRKRRNPMATRPPTFTGLSELVDNVVSDGSGENPICSNCHGTQTPLWRRGPDDELLCNACGVFYKVHKKHRPDNLAKAKNIAGGSADAVNDRGSPVPIECANCNAVATPMWRKAPDGRLLCNACALYYKCHKRPRPTHHNRVGNSHISQRATSSHGQQVGTDSTLSKPGHIDPRTGVRAETYYAYPGAQKTGSLKEVNMGMMTSTCGELNKFPLFQTYPPQH